MRINVLVKTSKSEVKVIRKEFGEYEVWLKSRPVKGQANKDLISTLADYFNVKPYNLRIVKGFTSPKKVIELAK
jgi:uncharacterized protein YggU (UPF0235/DUF167 family)